MFKKFLLSKIYAGCFSPNRNSGDATAQYFTFHCTVLYIKIILFFGFTINNNNLAF